ncbi:RagB/SusD family nutrient uptake outer membrane protein [Dyadobacter fanqingshengii]|uniref:RagB/SusD family nutrient uptake outer membrane protein n=1 Tax=Dyadobacter fanqingshengii TaxID=2906443 RepID=A0A9X1PB52_9BACT|nr:RagB/SusD family nutrient uptake outer membrane protein [Dyadobacter fanqingshengii]MCF0041335.1 RagB/SusD family nutrient uptake outer membrane protein [Dyadobacter fanqingshengii]MCF2505560.1 RagB/SusD family nutrient uptake outer membrane protein [Dyadobacter fanqingshengii]USJ36942.1 RagB/SusD family nutrient uptake outer membrane protein [Dyadobacter fanqingshengii]
MRPMKFIFASLMGFAWLLTSCSKDFLKPEPLSFFTPENVFVDKQGYEALLITMRKDLTREQTAQKNFMAHQSAASESGVPWLQMDFTMLTPNSDNYQQFVTQINDIFAMVKNANTIISRIDNITWKSEEEKNQILAEALWHRSYWYYRLVGNYGDLPFVQEEVKGVKLDFKTHSRWAILDKIQADMEFATQWMPVTASPGIPTKGAADHLLTKIYLANMEFQKAVNAATRVISGPYALMGSRFGSEAGVASKNVIWDLHRPENKNIAANKETILAFVDRWEAPQAARTVGLFTMRVYHCAWYNNAVAKDKDGNLGMIASGTLYDSLGRGNCDVAISDYQAYNIWKENGFDYKTTSDLRRANINWWDREELFYNNPASSQYRKPFDPKNMDVPSEYWARIFAMPWYKTYVPNKPGQTGIPLGSNGDWYIFRLAETYLLRAEAHYWLGQMAAAAEDINQVRTRAKALPIKAGDVTIDYIFDERARELFAEEPRQNELNRVSYIMASKGINGYNLTSIHEKNWFFDRVDKHNNFYDHYADLSFLGQSPRIAPHNFQWPIADNMITANAQGRINQNKGYVGSEKNVPPLEEVAPL